MTNSADEEAHGDEQARDAEVEDDDDVEGDHGDGMLSAVKAESSQPQPVGHFHVGLVADAPHPGAPRYPMPPVAKRPALRPDAP